MEIHTSSWARFASSSATMASARPAMFFSTVSSMSTSSSAVRFLSVLVSGSKFRVEIMGSPRFLSLLWWSLSAISWILREREREKGGPFNDDDENIPILLSLFVLTKFSLPQCEKSGFSCTAFLGQRHFIFFTRTFVSTHRKPR